jgi:hypothetical protein
MRFDAQLFCICTLASSLEYGSGLLGLYSYLLKRFLKRFRKQEAVEEGIEPGSILEQPLDLQSRMRQRHAQQTK